MLVFLFRLTNSIKKVANKRENSVDFILWQEAFQFNLNVSRTCTMQIRFHYFSLINVNDANARYSNCQKIPSVLWKWKSKNINSMPNCSKNYQNHLRSNNYEVCTAVALCFPNILGVMVLKNVNLFEDKNRGTASVV
jgi:hypothetical protein